jgi:general secretion pathway protein I
LKLARRAGGFTLVEVLVALVIVALGLTALMVAVNGTARTSGFLRDKTLAQWIALNRLTEVRLNMVKFGQNTDTGELDFGNRKWHYDTRYFDTSIASMKRVVVRVYLGDAKTKGNPVAQAVGFLGTALAAPGSLIVDWTTGINPANGQAGTGTGAPITPNNPTSPGTQNPPGTQNSPGTPVPPPPNPQPNPPGVPPTTP